MGLELHPSSPSARNRGAEGAARRRRATPARGLSLGARALAGAHRGARRRPPRRRAPRAAARARASARGSPHSSPGLGARRALASARPRRRARRRPRPRRARRAPRRPPTATAGCPRRTRAWEPPRVRERERSRRRGNVLTLSSPPSACSRRCGLMSGAHDAANLRAELFAAIWGGSRSGGETPPLWSAFSLSSGSRIRL